MFHSILKEAHAQIRGSVQGSALQGSSIIFIEQQGNLSDESDCSCPIRVQMAYFCEDELSAMVVVTHLPAMCRMRGRIRN